MRWFRGCALILILSPSLAATQVDFAPELTEVLADEVGPESWLRFRFLAPEIARELGVVSFEDAASTIDRLCQTMVLDYVAEFGLSPDKIAISLSDRLVPFGETNPNATQYFEVFSVRDDACIWEAF